MKSEPMFEDGVAAEAWLYEEGAIAQALRQSLASCAISGLQLPGAHRTSAAYHTQSPPSHHPLRPGPSHRNRAYLTYGVPNSQPRCVMKYMASKQHHQEALNRHRSLLPHPPAFNRRLSRALTSEPRLSCQGRLGDFISASTTEVGVIASGCMQTGESWRTLQSRTPADANIAVPVHDRV
jgi:hypothetical protein